MTTEARSLRLMASTGSVVWDCPHCAAMLVRRVDYVRILGPDLACPRCGRKAHIDLAALVVAAAEEARRE